MRTLAAALIVSAATAATGALAAGNLDFVLGKALFERDWIPAPASTGATDGLGPLFNSRSCAGCHAGPDLSARFTKAGDGRLAGRGLVVRFGDADGRGDPLYGTLLQTQAMQGLMPEGRVVLRTGATGAAYDISVDFDRGALAPETRMSFRQAPSILGRAALEKIDTAAVLALADPDDRDHDGISGRARMVEAGGAKVLGRFGWKAANPDLDHQIGDAFARDMGLASDIRPLPFGDCTQAEPDCLAAPSGTAGSATAELPKETVELVAAFVRGLPTYQALPSKDDVALFATTGCAACHVPSLPERQGAMVTAYTDLLLHDMGAGLDDGVGEPGVASSEWRTAPLAGLGGDQGRRRYMHDGRAATLDAAIRAHGGEAAAALARYESLAAGDREKLLAFLEAL